MIRQGMKVKYFKYLKGDGERVFNSIKAKTSIKYVNSLKKQLLK